MGVDEKFLGSGNASDSVQLDLEKIARFSSRFLAIARHLKNDGDTSLTAKEFRKMYNAYFGEEPLDSSMMEMFKGIYGAENPAHPSLFDEDYDTHTFKIPAKYYGHNYEQFPKEPE